MASKIYGPRKRRTRQHVIADLAVHHVEGFILEEGHTADRILHDYGYDLVMATFDERGYVEPDLVYFQVKASEATNVDERSLYCDIGLRDYNLWLAEQMPVIVVLYDANNRQGYWIHLKGYFREDETRSPRKGAKTVRVHFPSSQRMSRAAIVEMRRLKNAASESAGG